MKTLDQIKYHYSANEIWLLLFEWKEKNNIDLGAIGNGFTRKGKDYLDDLIKYFPEYAIQIQSIF